VLIDQNVNHCSECESDGGGGERPQSIEHIDVVTIFKVLFVEVSNRTLENRQQVLLDLEGDRDLRLFVVVKHLLTTQTQLCRGWSCSLCLGEGHCVCRINVDVVKVFTVFEGGNSTFDNWEPALL
jgi:hypothetical protein